MNSYFALCVALLFVLSTVGYAGEVSVENWPRWRGPHDLGSTTAGEYPTKFSDTENVAWKFELPGIGCSTPAVWGEHILVTAPVDGEDALLSLTHDGEVRWRAKIGPERAGKHRNGSGSNPSPVTDGETIFVYYKSGNLAAVDFAGKVLWKTNLQERFGKDTLYWDLGTSPVIADESVIVAVMHDDAGLLAAFDKQSGEMKWKIDRTYDTPQEGDHSYATPILIKQDMAERLIVWGAEHLTAHDTQTGETIWSCGGFNPDSKRFWVAVASHTIAGDMAIVPYGRGTHLAGVKLGGKGDVTESHRKWTREDTGSFVPSPAVYKDQVYLVRDSGEVVCLDPKTGDTVWEGRFPKNRNKYYASPLIAAGKMFAPREDGVVMVASVDGEFEFLGENQMGERIIASPVPLGNRLLIRGEKNLFCVGK